MKSLIQNSTEFGLCRTMSRCPRGKTDYHPKTISKYSSGAALTIADHTPPVLPYCPSFTTLTRRPTKPDHPTEHSAELMPAKIALQPGLSHQPGTLLKPSSPAAAAWQITHAMWHFSGCAACPALPSEWGTALRKCKSFSAAGIGSSRVSLMLTKDCCSTERIMESSLQRKPEIKRASILKKSKLIYHH